MAVCAGARKQIVFRHQVYAYRFCDRRRRKRRTVKVSGRIAVERHNAHIRIRRNAPAVAHFRWVKVGVQVLIERDNADIRLCRCIPRHEHGLNLRGWIDRVDLQVRVDLGVYRCRDREAVQIFLQATQTAGQRRVEVDIRKVIRQTFRDRLAGCGELRCNVFNLCGRRLELVQHGCDRLRDLRISRGRGHRVHHAAGNALLECIGNIVAHGQRQAGDGIGKCIRCQISSVGCVVCTPRLPSQTDRLCRTACCVLCAARVELVGDPLPCSVPTEQCTQAADARTNSRADRGTEAGYDRTDCRAKPCTCTDHAELCA